MDKTGDRARQQISDNFFAPFQRTCFSNVAFVEYVGTGANASASTTVSYVRHVTQLMLLTNELIDQFAIVILVVLIVIYLNNVL